MLFQGINVVSLSVSNLDRAREFYGDVLGLGKPLYDLPDAGWIEYRVGGSGNLSLTKGEDKISHSTTVVLNVEDCFLAVKELRKRAVKCDDPVVFTGFITFANFYDPFGNRLQICSPAPSN